MNRNILNAYAAGIKCLKCGETKPETKFYNNAGEASGKDRFCSDCRKAQVKASQAKSKARNQVNQFAILHEKEFLEFLSLKAEFNEWRENREYYFFCYENRSFIERIFKYKAPLIQILTERGLFK